MERTQPLIFKQFKLNSSLCFLLNYAIINISTLALQCIQDQTMPFQFLHWISSIELNSGSGVLLNSFRGQVQFFLNKFWSAKFQLLSVNFLNFLFYIKRGQIKFHYKFHQILPNSELFLKKNIVKIRILTNRTIEDFFNGIKILTFP